MLRVMSVPLAQNENVKELLLIMEENRAPTMQDFVDLLAHVTEVERQFAEAVSTLQAMQLELNAAKEHSHPGTATLQDAIKAIESSVAALREQIDALKQSVAEGCRNAVDAFKEKGIAALDNTARFFRIRPLLESVRDSLKTAIQAEDKAIATIESISIEYHQAGRHVKNIFRAVAGKQAVPDIKAAGKLAEALRTPIRLLRSAHTAMKDRVEAVIEKLGQLEMSAERRPSIEKAMQSYQEQIRKTPKAAAHREAR